MKFRNLLEEKIANKEAKKAVEELRRLGGGFEFEPRI